MELPYPLARDVDAQPQPGRSSTAEQMAALKAQVEEVLLRTGARQVVLVANSRGGYAVRNSIQNGGGAALVSHAILGGTPNHGVWSIRGFREGNEFSGTGPFLQGLNAPRDEQGDEVDGPVKWMTLRSDSNDKYAQPDGLWIGAPGKPTGVSHEGPALRGAQNVVLPGVDHRETAFSPQAFAAMFRFITGREPQADILPEGRVVLSGRVSGLGLDPTDPGSGSFVNNLPLRGATLTLHACEPATGLRQGAALASQVIGPDGQWGPVAVPSGASLEFEIRAPGYAVTHVYRSAFARSSSVVQLRPERLGASELGDQTVVVFTRPRGYFDAQRDHLLLDGSDKLPGLPATGAGVSSVRLKLAPASGRAVVGQFNHETVVGRTWPAAGTEGGQGGGQEVTVLELTY